MADVSYLGRHSKHWNELTNENAPADALRMTLGIAAAPEPEVEDTMSKSKKKQPEKTAETPQVEVNPTPEKKSKAPKVAKAEKAAKPKEEALVVFAFRLTEAERDAIHKAAGPARASRFVRTIAVAAANEDEAAIRTVIKDAREARA